MGQIINRRRAAGIISGPDYSKQYLTFVTLESGTFKLGARGGSESISYSLDGGETWVSLNQNTNSPTVTIGNKIMWKGELIPQSGDYNGIGTFSSTGLFTVEGNIMSLLYGDDFEGQTNLTGKALAFYDLFTNSKLVRADNLVLPATTLASQCYYQMFYSCTSLTAAPIILPAITLAAQCYYQMFSNCTSLTTTPELPATTLATQCYMNMFYGCTSLTTASELPATTLVSDCYNFMFYGTNVLPDCTNIDFTSTAVVLSGGLKGLFGGTKVTYTDLVQILPKDVNDNPCLPVTTLTVNCYESMFYRCTALTKAPELSATTLTYNCYCNMFSNCTGLTTAPELPATTLASSCYYSMFQGCSSLSYIKCLATDISAANCTYYWVKNVAATGIFLKEPNMTSWQTGNNGIPENWVVITDETELPILWTKNQYSYPINSQSKPQLANPFNVPLTCSSSNSNVATIDNYGNVTYVGEGTCTLTAIFSGNDDYQAKTVTCTLTVTEAEILPYFTIKSLADNNTITLKASHASIVKIVSVSTDNGVTWTDKTSTTSGVTLATLSNGGKLLIKGSNTAYSSSSYYNYFTSTQRFEVEGNIMSLIYDEEFKEQTSLPATYTFKYLFRSCTNLVSAENLKLPATTLTNYCYQYMFNGCSSLTTAPELPATTLKSNCYGYMFQNCSNLNYIKAAFTTTPSTSYTRNWVSGVKSTGTFYKNSAATWSVVTGANGVPSGWTVVTYTP